MKKLIYTGLIASSLCGIVGCEKDNQHETNYTSMGKDIPYGYLPVAIYPVPNSNSPLALAVEDINGDGKKDIIVTTYAESTRSIGDYGRAGIYVFLNNGDGTYTPQKPAAKAELEKNK